MERSVLNKKLDDMISSLVNWKSDKRLPIPEPDMVAMLNVARQVLLSEPMLLSVQPPVNILGDIHGQFRDLLRYFETSGHPPSKRYLLLGDYVDRGQFSVETLTLLLAYKVRYPTSVHLLRGNHESASINHYYGFYDECKRRFTVRLWKNFVDTYNCLPVAAVIDSKIFCCHGGLSPALHELSDIHDIERPVEVKQNGLLCDLLWSDPDPAVTTWTKNSRGVSFTFGVEQVEAFLTRFNFDLVCRAHQVVEDGYEFFAKRQLITVFSAVNYCGEYDNAGAMMCVDPDLNITLVVMKPKKHEPDHRKKPIVEGAPPNMLAG
ncbi:serine/threonine-protein phosphatase PP1-like [Drosophila madeirensis]|uniref:Serine/threonine-protein phosphatase n=1 Tax=Drosophila madeirensis TaxID=30013 RepID=A0AAU9G858_DROMD